MSDISGDKSESRHKKRAANDSAVADKTEKKKKKKELKLIDKEDTKPRDEVSGLIDFYNSMDNSSRLDHTLELKQAEVDKLKIKQQIDRLAIDLEIQARLFKNHLLFDAGEKHEYDEYVEQDFISELYKIVTEMRKLSHVDHTD